MGWLALFIVAILWDACGSESATQFTTTGEHRKSTLHHVPSSLLAVQIDATGELLTWPTEVGRDLPLCISDPLGELDTEAIPPLMHKNQMISRKEVFVSALRASVDIIRSACGIGFHILEEENCVAPEATDDASADELCSNTHEQSIRTERGGRHPTTPPSSASESNLTRAWFTVSPWHQKQTDGSASRARVGSAPVMGLLQRWVSGYWGRPFLHGDTRGDTSAALPPWSVMQQCSSSNSTYYVPRPIPKRERYQATVYVDSSMPLAMMTRVMTHELGHAMGFIHEDSSPTEGSMGVFDGSNMVPVTEGGFNPDSASFMAYHKSSPLLSSNDIEASQYLYGPPDVTAPQPSFVTQHATDGDMAELKKGHLRHAVSCNVSSHSFNSLEVVIEGVLPKSQVQPSDQHEGTVTHMGLVGENAFRTFCAKLDKGSIGMYIAGLYDHWMATGFPPVPKLLASHCPHLCVHFPTKCTCEMVLASASVRGVEGLAPEVMAMACSLDTSPQFVGGFLRRQPQESVVLPESFGSNTLNVQLDLLNPNWSSLEESVSQVDIYTKQWHSTFVLKLGVAVSTVKFGKHYQQRGSLMSRGTHIASVYGRSVSFEDVREAITASAPKMDLNDSNERRKKCITLSLRNAALSLKLSDLALVAPQLVKLDAGETQLGPRVDLSVIADIDEVVLDSAGLTAVDFSSTCKGVSCSGIYSIRRLDLSRNRITSIPRDLMHLQRLEVLNLAYNSIKTLPSRESLIASPFRSLRKLDVRGNLVRSVPDYVWSLPNIDTVDISSNLITRIIMTGCNASAPNDDALKHHSRHTGIRAVVASYNALREFPTVDESCSKSQVYLDLSFNSIGGRISLPGTRWGKLETILLEQNEISEIENSTLLQTPNLHTLNVANNQIQTLPDLFHAVPKLVTMEVRRNLLRSLPPSLSALPRLKLLDASSNQLAHALNLSCSLSTLNLSHNKLQNLTFGCEDGTRSGKTLKPLRRIDVSNNFLCALPDYLNDCDLTHFDASHNRLSGLPPKLSVSELFDVSHNQITRAYPMLARFHCSFAWNRLQEFDLAVDHDFWLLSDSYESHSGFRRLLDLSHNEISSGMMTSYLGNIKLDLSYNRIGLVSLRSLWAIAVDLSHNEIIGFQTAWSSRHHNQPAVDIDLRHNNITEGNLFVSGPRPELYGFETVNRILTEGSGLDRIFTTEKGAGTQIHGHDLLLKCLQVSGQKYSMPEWEPTVPAALYRAHELVTVTLQLEDVGPAPVWPMLRQMHLYVPADGLDIRFLQHMERLETLVIRMDMKRSGAARKDNFNYDTEGMKPIVTVKTLDLDSTSVCGSALANAVMHLFPNLERLTLDSPRVEFVPMTPKLRELRVYQFRDRTFKYSFLKPPGLAQPLLMESVDLRGSEMGPGDLMILCEMHRLKSLRLFHASHLPRCSLPASIEALMFENYGPDALDLRHITHLTKLKSLEIQRSSLEPIGDTLAPLGRLERFILKDTNVRNVPDYLRHVSDVVIARCPLDTIPDWLDLAPFIRIRGGRLTSIPAGVCNGKVESILLDGTNLTSLAVSEAFSSCDRLERLTIVNSRLTGRLRLKLGGKVQFLDLSGNMLSDVPMVTAPLRLKVLSLARNNLRRLDAARLNTLRSVRELDMSHNQLESLPNLSALNRLRYMNVSGNLLEALPSDIPSTVNRLDASHNHLTLFPRLGNHLTLKRLFVSHNNISQIEAESIPARLEVLDGSFNRLQTTPQLMREHLVFVVRGSVLNDRRVEEETERDALAALPEIMAISRWYCGTNSIELRVGCFLGKAEALSAKPLVALVRAALVGELSLLVDARALASRNFTEDASLSTLLEATYVGKSRRAIVSLSDDEAVVMMVDPNHPEWRGHPRLPSRRFLSLSGWTSMSSVAIVSEDGETSVYFSHYKSPDSNSPIHLLGEGRWRWEGKTWASTHAAVIEQVRKLLSASRLEWGKNLRVVNSKDDNGLVKLCSGPECLVQIWVRDNRLKRDVGPDAQNVECVVEIVGILSSGFLFQIHDDANVVCIHHEKRRVRVGWGRGLYFITKTDPYNQVNSLERKSYQ